MLLVASFFMQSCSMLRRSHHEASAMVASIDKMIAIVQPELNKNERRLVASQISNAIKKHKIEPNIIVAIIDTESNFKANKVSSTGDVSVAQINVEVWNKEFIRMKRQPMIKYKLKQNQEYALVKMVEILSIIKSRYGKKDRNWYARYHSNTQKYKSDYLKKLDIRLKMLAAPNRLTAQVASASIQKKLILQ